MWPEYRGCCTPWLGYSPQQCRLFVARLFCHCRGDLLVVTETMGLVLSCEPGNSPVLLCVPGSSEQLLGWRIPGRTISRGVLPRNRRSAWRVVLSERLFSIFCFHWSQSFINDLTGPYPEALHSFILRVPFNIILRTPPTWGHAVALRHCATGRGFDSRWGHCIFQLT
jgi:hypothetical protein